MIEDLHWQAGMFEGEGSIRISRPAPRNAGSLCVDLTNGLAEIPAAFCAMWGGSIKYHPADPPRREQWRWRCSSRQAAAFLTAMYPLLVTDRYRERCVVALDFQDQKAPGGHGGPGYVDRQWEFYDRMAILNRRGTPQEVNQPAKEKPDGCHHNHDRQG